MPKRPYYKIAAITLLAFAVIAVKLAFIMLSDSSELSAQAFSQKTRTVDYYQYCRGDIVDRNDRQLTNVVENCLLVFPTAYDEAGPLAKELSEILSLSERQIETKLVAEQNGSLEPFVLKTGLSEHQKQLVEAADINGVFVVSLASRYSAYKYVCHLIGMVQQNERGDYAGISGLELQYDQYLDSRSSPQIAAYIDVYGNVSGNSLIFVDDRTKKSNTLCLTIDMDYQQIVERALADYSGACVVMDVTNGDVLAAASSPQFDAYGWDTTPEEEVYVNKALALYPPASTFKLLLAMIAIEEGISLGDNFVCTNSITLENGHIVHCQNEKGHGNINMAEALAQSCNCYFVQLGQKIGGETIKKYASLSGLDQQYLGGYQLTKQTHIDFNSNVVGDVANVCLGEKGVRLSPLMVAQLVSVVANGGNHVYPRLVKGVYDSQEQTVMAVNAITPQRVFSDETAASVADMMALTVEQGTAYHVKDALISCGGKTGTSEDAGVWFAGFAPLENPRWAIAVYIEDASAGGVEGADVFRQVIDDLAVLEGMV